MNKAFFWAPLVGLVIVGCGSYSPSTKQSRGMEFPLRGCTDASIALAGAEYAKFDPAKGGLVFNEQWVCVTRTEGKRRYDDATGSEASQKALRDASMGDLGMPPRIDKSPGIAEPSMAPADAIRAFPAQEITLREWVEYPLVRNNNERSLGIALAGGGSKAAAFGSGVLAGMADEDLLDTAQYISTVSGGGYAAYFYYTHKILPGQRRQSTGDYQRTPDSKALYRDCQRVPTGQATLAVLQRIRLYRDGGCEVDELAPGRGEREAEKIKYQMFKRCQQDILQPGQCSTARTEEDLGISGWALSTTLLTAPLSWITTVLFDWGIPTSPAANAYRDGIGMAYGTTLTNTRPVLDLGKPGFIDMAVRCPPDAAAFAVDCTPGPNNSIPTPMSYNEFLKGLQSAKAGGSPLPFWIINAVATKNRSGFGWFTNAGKFDTVNSDTFEMTAVSHGSGRYGFVSTNMGIHGFDVLMSVGAAAAFLDPNQNVAGGRLLRGPIGVAQRMFNVDWGIDISNYNVSDARRTLHTSMPFPFFDAPLSEHIVHRGQPDEDKERVGSVFIRLIDGGNGDNLGLYSLLRRKVNIAVVSDAAADEYGAFDDLCEVRRRLSYAPTSVAKDMIIPGLQNFGQHCDDLQKGVEVGYGVRAWPFERYPVLLGCIRFSNAPRDLQPCKHLKDGETRLFIVKPALDLSTLRKKQYFGVPAADGIVPTLHDCTLPGEAYRPGIVNCGTAAFVMGSWNEKQGNCQSFPQHSTVLVTANSSATIFSAYRELGRQYTSMAGDLIRRVRAKEAGADDEFDDFIDLQSKKPFFSRPWSDPTDPPCGGRAARMPMQNSAMAISGALLED